MTITTERRPSAHLTPSWEVAYLFPAQGMWSESDYFALTERTNWLVELSDGCEVVSADAPEHDLVTKRAEYAQAGIPEYWIVEPQSEHITVLSLQGSAYIEQGRYVRGDTIQSPLLVGFSVAVAAIFDKG